MARVVGVGFGRRPSVCLKRRGPQPGNRDDRFAPISVPSEDGFLGTYSEPIRAAPTEWRFKVVETVEVSPLILGGAEGDRIADFG